jgi:GTP-binding protein Era
MSYHAGFVGLIGQPNAGKSSLMNVLVNEKVSIVAAKPQTTRRRIMGIRSQQNYQIVFVDAPGVIKADKGINSFLMKEAEEVAEESDVLLVVLNVDEKTKENIDMILDWVSAFSKPKVFLIHKVDLVEFERRVLKIQDMIKEKFKDATVFSFSSKQPDPDAQVQLLQKLVELLPPSQKPLYEVDLFTPHTTRELVCELVREQCFTQLHQEIPYGIAVQIQKFDETNPDLPRIAVNIYVNKENHKSMVIGKAGAQLKKIGIEARKQIEKIIGTKVFLSLNVAVKENWQTNKRMLKELGYHHDE